jgi:hypothetical protein
MRGGHSQLTPHLTPHLTPYDSAIQPTLYNYGVPVPPSKIKNPFLIGSQLFFSFITEIDDSWLKTVLGGRCKSKYKNPNTKIFITGMIFTIEIAYS